MRLMMVLILFFTLPTELVATVATAHIPASVVQVTQTTQPTKTKTRFFKRFSKWSSYRELDKLAIWSAGLVFGSVILSFLVGIIANDFFVAAYVLMGCTPAILAGIVCGIIALARVPYHGWRRGTFWAIVALGVPFLSLLLVAVSNGR